MYIYNIHVFYVYKQKKMCLNSEDGITEIVLNSFQTYPLFHFP